MRVSVVIPLYNKVRHIRRAVDSVLAQTYQDFEVIVVDDGSTDGGGDVVREMTDPRIRLISQENAGECAARNRGINESNSELIAFLDADDEWLPCFLETVIGLRDKYPEAGMYASAFCYCRDNVRWNPVYTHCVSSPVGGLLDDYFLSALSAPMVTSSSVMIPKTVFDEVSGFPVGIKRAGDLQIWARIALRYRVAWSPVLGAVYNLSADNRICQLVPMDFAPDAFVMKPVEEFLQSNDKTVSLRLNVEEYCVSSRINYAIACYLEGKRKWAFYHLDKAHNTSKFRKKILFLRAVFWLPPRLVKFAMSVKAQVRRLMPRAGIAPANR